MSDDKTPSFAVMVDTTALREFRDTLFLHCAPTEEIPLRVFGNEGGLTMAGVATVGGPLEPIVEMAMAAASSTDGGTFCPPIMTSKRGWRATEADIESAPVATAEIDHSPERGRATIVQLLGVPTATIWSGGVTKSGEAKVHLHYRLKRPARTREEVLKLKRLRAMMALAAGGDRTSITPVHPLRWPGSLWLKQGAARPVKMDLNKHVEIDLDAAIAMMIEAGYDAPIEIDKTPTEKKLLAPNLEALDAVVRGIPNDGDTDWERFNTVGMAIRNASGGTDEGLGLFDEWCAKSPRYDAKGTSLRWEHWARHPADRIGYEHLRSMSTTAYAPGIEEVREKVRRQLGLREQEISRIREEIARESEEAAVAALEAELDGTDEPTDISDADIISAQRMANALVSDDTYKVMTAEDRLDWCLDQAMAATPAWREWKLIESEDITILPERFKTIMSASVKVPSAEEVARETEADELERVREDLKEAQEAAVVSETSMDWILDECPSETVRRLARAVQGAQAREMPSIALMTALAMASVCGRGWVVEGRYRTGLNLYMVLAAGTARGKSASMSAVKAAAMWSGIPVSKSLTHPAALHGELIGDDDKGLQAADRSAGSLALVVDEAWNLVEKVTGDKVDMNQRAVLGTLLELHPYAGGGRLEASSYASRKNRLAPINDPYMVMFGMTTPKAYHQMMSEELTRLGFTNRVLMLSEEGGTLAPEDESRILRFDDDDRETLQKMALGGRLPALSDAVAASGAQDETERAGFRGPADAAGGERPYDTP